MIFNLTDKNVTEQITATLTDLKNAGLFTNSGNEYLANEGEVWDIEIHGVTINGKKLIVTETFLEIDENVKINITQNTGNMWFGMMKV